MNPIKTDALLLLLALFVAAGAAWLAGSLDLWVVGGAAIAFTVTLVLVMFVRQMGFARKISRIERGLVDYEASLGERLGKITAETVSRGDIEALKRELQLERVTQRITDGEESSPTASTSLSSEEIDPSSEGDAEEKVVPFLRIVKDEENESASEAKESRKDRSATKREITLFLQPVVSLNARRTRAFDIVPGFLEEDGAFVPLNDGAAKLKRNVSAARADLMLLEQAFDLLRSLDLEGTDVKFNLPISGGAVESKKLFKEFLRLLRLHDRFGGTLFLSLDQSKFGALSKPAYSRLIEVKDAGFGLMLGDCRLIADALLAVSDGRADGMVVDISTLRQNEPASGGNPELDLISQASQAGVPLIVTNVSIEAQVMELLDCSIELASGSYFSGPKAPKIGLRGTEPAQA